MIFQIRKVRDWLGQWWGNDTKCRSRKRPDRYGRRLPFDCLEERSMLAIAIGPELVGYSSQTVQATGGVVQVGNTIYFQGVNTANDLGAELYKTDLTSFTPTLVRDIEPGATGSNPIELTNVNGTLYFIAADSTSGLEVWKSDGTSAGTQVVAEISPGALPSFPQFLTNVNGTLFFSAEEINAGRELYKSDGTSAGTVIVKDIYPGFFNSSFPFGLTNVNGTLFFRADDGVTNYELWKSDGTCAGTVLVRDINPGMDMMGYAYGSLPSGLFNLNGTLYFAAGQAGTGFELWKSDGTSVGTVLVKDINPTGDSFTPYSRFTNVNGVLFFGAGDGVGGTELWKSNGTSAGTVLVKDINTAAPGAGSSPSSLTNVNGTLFFSAFNPTFGYELWKSDGTLGGTQLVKDTLDGPLTGNPTGLTNVNGALYFAAGTLSSGTELWRSDGTSGGTAVLKNINAGGGSYPTNLINVGGTLVFRADRGVIGNELWKSDGTFAGTVPQANTSNDFPRDPTNFTEVNGVVFFTATTTAGGAELWRSDGTIGGTKLVKDINPGGASSSPGSFVNANGVLYFAADNGTNGRELWKSDGTAAGTVLVRDIRVGSLGSFPENLFYDSALNVIRMAADNGVVGRELASYFIGANSLVVSDVTLGGDTDPRQFTRVGPNIYFIAGPGNVSRLVDVETRDLNQFPVVLNEQAGLVNVNGTLFFSASAFANSDDFELWKTDGTSGGTVLVKDIFTGSGLFGDGSFITQLTNLNGTLVFSASELGNFFVKLWKSDGTSAGTQPLSGEFNGSFGSNLDEFTVVGSTLYFNGNVSEGSELWKSDGTCAGTQLVRDIFPGADGINPNSSFPSDLTNFNGTLYFTATDGFGGRELWQSDGTSSGVAFAGTSLAGDINPGAGDSNPSGLTVAGGKLFMGANNGTANRLWVLDPVNSGTLTISGSAGGDSLLVQFLTPTTYFAFADGAVLFPSTGTYPTINVAGGGGFDSFQFAGPPTLDRASLTASAVSIAGATYQLNGTNLEVKYLFGEAQDEATFADTAGNDTMYQLPQFSIMLDSTLSYFNQVTGYANVTSNATAGTDLLFTYGTAGDEIHQSAPGVSIMSGSGGLSLTGNNFDQVYAFGLGGDDTAAFQGSPQDEQYYGLDGYSIVLSSTLVQYMVDFDQVLASGNGGNDLALFFDSPGNDTLTGNSAFTQVKGPTLDNTAIGFDSVFVIASLGGNDTANLTSLAAGDLFSGNAFDAAFFKPGQFLVQVYGFETVNLDAATFVFASMELIDGVGNDTLAASGGTATLTYSTGNRIAISNLVAGNTLNVNGANGGVNTKQVVDPLLYVLNFFGTWV